MTEQTIIQPQLFPLILSDPPWEYKDRCNAGKRGAAHKYDTMKLEDIKLLPVDKVAAPDSELWLWGTWPLLKEALAIMDAWGFEYKTLGFDWMKVSKAGRPLIRGGSGTRSNTEFCIRGIKGNGLQRVDAGVPSAILTVPSKRHSRKPQEARERLVRLYGDIPRLELFATDPLAGWVQLGDKIDGRDIRDSLPELIPPAQSGSQISIWDFAA